MCGTPIQSIHISFIPVKFLFRMAIHAFFECFTGYKGISIPVLKFITAERQVMPIPVKHQLFAPLPSITLPPIIIGPGRLSWTIFPAAYRILCASAHFKIALKALQSPTLSMVRFFEPTPPNQRLNGRKVYLFLHPNTRHGCALRLIDAHFKHARRRIAVRCLNR